MAAAKANKTFLLLTLCFLLGCGNSQPDIVPTVHAQVPLWTPQRKAPCYPEGCVYSEAPGSYLALHLGVTPTFPANTLLPGKSWSYRLPYAMEVQALDGWMGSYGDSVMEFDSRLVIQKPNGTGYEFWLQYDKHEGNDPGEKQRYFPVNLSLPAGTVLTIEHTPIPCFTNQCAYDAVWHIYGH